MRKAFGGTCLCLVLSIGTASALDLEVEITDGKGAPITGLQAADLQFQVGGKPVEVENLRYVDGLAETMIYVGAEMPAAEFGQIDGAIRKMIDGLPDGVQVSLGGTPFTADKAVLNEYLKHGVELPKKTPDAGFVKIWDFGQGYRVHGRPVLDNYSLLASQLAGVPGQKLAVIYRLSLELRQDGLDTRDMNIRTGSVRQNDADMLRNEDDVDRLGTIAAVSRVRFYPTNAPAGVGSMDDHGLNAVARHTGGKPMLGGANPDDVFRLALEDLPGYYVATVHPPLDGKGSRRNLKASIVQKGAHVELARGYLLDLPGLGAVGAPREDLLSRSAADATLTIRANHWVFRGQDGKPVVIVSAGAPVNGLKTTAADKGVAVELALAGGYKGDDGWTSSARNRTRQVFEKKAFANAQKSEDVTIDVAAFGALPGPGMHAWKTVLKDEAGGAAGVMETQAGTHDLSRPMATSDVLITRRAVQIKPDTPAEPWGDLLDFGGSRLIPESTREFHVGDSVLFTYRLYNAPAEMVQNPPPVQLALFKDEAQLESFDGQGQSQAVGDSEIQYVGQIQTKGLEPGEYLILSAVPGREDERHPYVEGAFRLVKK